MNLKMKALIFSFFSLLFIVLFAPESTHAAETINDISSHNLYGMAQYNTTYNYYYTEYGKPYYWYNRVKTSVYNKDAYWGEIRNVTYSPEVYDDSEPYWKAYYAVDDGCDGGASGGCIVWDYTYDGDFLSWYTNEDVSFWVGYWALDDSQGNFHQVIPIISDAWAASKSYADTIEMRDYFDLYY